MHRYTLQMQNLLQENAWQCLPVLPLKAKFHIATIPNPCKLFI